MEISRYYTQPSELSKIDSNSFINEADLTPDNIKNVPKLLIPKSYIFGTQSNGSYDRKAKKRLSERLKSPKGYIDLLNNPSIACAIPKGNDMEIAILDGHHRTRYSTDRRVVPAYVFTPEQIVEIINRKNPTKKITVNILIQDIEKSVVRTLESFGNMPTEKSPQLVKGVKNVADLVKHPQFKDITPIKPRPIINFALNEGEESYIDLWFPISRMPLPEPRDKIISTISSFGDDGKNRRNGQMNI